MVGIEGGWVQWRLLVDDRVVLEQGLFTEKGGSEGASEEMTTNGGGL